MIPDDDDNDEGFISLDMFSNKGYKDADPDTPFTTTPDYGILEVKKELGVDIIQEIKKTFEDD
jgi:hypothetical protein